MSRHSFWFSVYLGCFGLPIIRFEKKKNKQITFDQKYF